MVSSDGGDILSSMQTTIQSKLVVALTSSTTWTLVALFVYNALNSNVGLLPNGWSAIINVVLMILAGYLHANKVQTAAVSGSTK